MRKKAYSKDIKREILYTFNRFMCIFLIVALGVAFFAGIRATEPDMRKSADKYFDENNLMDIQIISTGGLTQDDIDALKELEGIKDIEPSYSVDMLQYQGDEQNVMRIMSLPDTINRVRLVTGRMPENADECIIDTKFASFDAGIEIGDEIVLFSGTGQEPGEILENATLKVVGTCMSPCYLSFEREASRLGTGSVTGFVFTTKENFKQNYYSSIYVTGQKTAELLSYSEEYENEVRLLNERIEELGTERCEAGYIALIDFMPEWYVLDRNYIASCAEFGENAERIGAIGKVFPVIFFLVAILVSLTTMTRMIEEERTQIGTMKALGYGNFRVAWKYIVYCLLASVSGSIVGAIVGQLVLPYTIMNAYYILYDNMPYLITEVDAELGVTAGLIACACTLFATLTAYWATMKSNAAELMRPTAPAPGKRVFVERIGFLWRHLGFTGKASVRNLLRYKKRFFMTVFGIGGCMALLLVGFGLNDSIYTIIDNQFYRITMYDGAVTLNEGSELRAKLFDYLDGEDAVTDYMKIYQTSMNAGFGNEERSVSVVVPFETENLDKYIYLGDRLSGELYGDDEYESGAIISEKLSILIGASAGDTIYVMDADNVRHEVKISAVTENYVNHYIYMTPKIYEAVFGIEPECNAVYLLYDETVLGEEALGERILEYDAVSGLSWVRALEDTIYGMFDSLNFVVYVLIISAGLLAFVVLYNLSNININERRRELATLKVLGFFDGEVSSYIFRENVMLTIIGSAVGIVFGIFLHRYVILTAEVDLTMFGREIKPLSFLYAVALTFIFSAIVSMVMHFRMKAIDMVESLKSIE